MKQALSEEAVRVFDMIAGILLRCFIMTVAALLFVWIMIFIMGDYFYYIYSIFIDIPRKNYDQFLFYALTIMKVLNVMFFLFPYLAIKHFLRGKNKERS